MGHANQPHIPQEPAWSPDALSMLNVRGAVSSSAGVTGLPPDTISSSYCCPLPKTNIHAEFEVWKKIGGGGGWRMKQGGKCPQPPPPPNTALVLHDEVVIDNANMVLATL